MNRKGREGGEGKRKGEGGAEGGRCKSGDVQNCWERVVLQG